jgi:hypothetical protein
MKLKIFTALVVFMVPVLAQAKPVTTHMRPQLFRDRAPKARVRDAHTHEIKVRPPRSAPPPPVNEDF